MKRSFFALLIACLLVITSAVPVLAQSPAELELGLSRDWGYGGFGNDIQGLFTMKIKNPPEALTRVVFLIDGNSIGEDAEPPFSLQFNTDSYALGVHALSAAGYTSSGDELTSNIIQAEFVPATAATGAITKILVPILALVLLMIAFSFIIPLILNKGKLSTIPPGASRNYGIGGGAICPKCGRPFPLRLWWINLGWNKIDRCPYCGKWSFLRPSSLSDLRAAEAAEISQAQPGLPVNGEAEVDRLNKDLDDSKYQDV